MLDIYEFEDFRVFLQSWIKSQARAGRGLLARWAEEMGVHPTLLSQILSGKKELSLELAEHWSRLISLSGREQDYFLLLVQHQRAGSTHLREHFQHKITEAQERARHLATRLQNTTEFDPLAKAEFYSSWIYAGIRNLSALPEMNSTDALAHHLKLPRDLVAKVVEFLLQHGLCVLDNGQLSYGPKRTHISSDSPLVAQHHRNWRGQGQLKMDLQRKEDLFFSFPMSLSKQDADKLRQRLPQWIEEVHKLVEPSPSETVRCLNIDYFEY